MLKYHIQALHGQMITYPCPHCKDLYMIPDKLSAHLRLHGPRLYKCKYCIYNHYQRSLVTRHVRDKHPMLPLVDVVVREPDDDEASRPLFKPWRCGLCKYQALSQPEVVEHAASVHDLRSQFKCGLCSVRSSVRSALDLHFAAKHPSEAVNVFAIYYRLDEVDAEAAVKVEHCQPIWTRHNPRRIRHVRGILIEEVKDEQEEEREETEETKEGKETEKVKESKESPAAGCVKAEGAPHAATEDEFLSLYETKSCELGPTGDAEGKQFVCPKCTKYKTKRKMDFARHLHKELGYNRFVCGNCGHMNTNLPNMKRHHEMAHKTARLPEAIVPLTPDSAIEQWIQSVLDHQEHQIEGTAPSDQPTEEPKLEAKSEPESKAESKLEPKPEPGSVSASPADTSKTQPVYKCSYCSERGTIPVLRGHWKTLHSHLRFKVIRQARRYVCNHCDFQSAKMPGIRAHMASRHPDQPATDFQTRTHDRETRFKCGWCRERFLTRDKATSHHQVFHSHLELKLDTYAARGLPQAVGAAQAETTEPAASAEPAATGDKPAAAAAAGESPLPSSFKCPLCPHTTSRLTYVDAHMLVHYKRYKCQRCDFADGSRRLVVRHHARKHAGEPEQVTLLEHLDQEYQKMKRVVRGRDGPRVGSPAPSDATTGSRGTKRYSEVTTQLTLGGASAMRVNVPTLAQIVKLYPRIAVVDLRKKKLQL
ncbi:zinc finger protein 462-like [Pollicipes pollicipes]|uniref:zinc finger protein 462-like n=1 Tax=Pollicipes pollicipes TaxID=41117 RepID=UPI0018856236|nr:zinc finger protein 462-like [Pollicipes pollicipes]